MITEILENKEFVALVIGILGIIYQQYKAGKFQQVWKAEEQTEPAPVESSGAVVVMENPDLQSTQAFEVMVKAIPPGAEIKKIDEGISSGGSKYRLVYYTVRK